MGINNEKSSIKLVSNIMLKEEDEKNRQQYIPADMIKNGRDTRRQGSLTPLQREQNIKSLFYASEIVDEAD